MLNPFAFNPQSAHDKVKKLFFLLKMTFENINEICQEKPKKRYLKMKG